MSKVTSKLQVTIPKRLAEEYSISPGDEIEWVAAGEAIRVIPPGRPEPTLSKEQRLKLFDGATARQVERELEGERRPEPRGPGERGWKREELYERGRTG